MATRFGILALLAVVAISGAFFAMSKIRSGTQEPRDLGGVHSFTLFDQEGRPFHSEDLAGQVWVADFFFTRCKGICPILSGRMLDLSRELEDLSGWRLVSISVDPSHDTPEVLKSYAVTLGVDTPRWSFLTGPEQQVRELIRTQFMLPVDDNPQNAEEPILHSPRIVLVDREGNLRGFYDALDAEDMQGLLKDTRRLLEQTP